MERSQYLSYPPPIRYPSVVVLAHFAPVPLSGTKSSAVLCRQWYLVVGGT